MESKIKTRAIQANKNSEKKRSDPWLSEVGGWWGGASEEGSQETQGPSDKINKYGGCDVHAKPRATTAG